jgi:acetolactate synthase-1/2/3 large subunit
MTLLGLGGLPGAHELSLDMLGMHGTVYANHAVSASDLIISVGARFDDRVTGKLDEFAPQAKIIHIDIDPTSISKNVAVEIPIVGDAKRVLTDLLPLVKKTAIIPWREKIAAWKRDYPLLWQDEPG